MSLTEAQQARADALTAAAQLVTYPDNSTSPYETLLALAEWILGDEVQPIDGLLPAYQFTLELPDWDADPRVTGVFDKDGDLWERTEDGWESSSTMGIYSATSLNAEFGPIKSTIKES